MKRTSFALILLGIATTAAFGADDNTILIKHFDFMRMNMTVPLGATVTWKNLDGEPHTVVAVDGTFRSPALDENDSFSFKFDKAGTFKYICSIHPKMKAIITVK